jgi:hypothetical protein
MSKILLKGLVIELGEKVGLGRLIELANLVDQLTFVHGVFTFGFSARSGATALRDLPTGKIGYRAAFT